MMTLAPERNGAIEAMQRLTARGVHVSLGHADATEDKVRAAVHAGATLVTHLFTAMRPFRHRDPAVPGAARTDPRRTLCLIGDCGDVHAIACRLAFHAAGGRIALVSDSVPRAGMPTGTTLGFGGRPATMDEQGLGRHADATISGAGTLRDEGVRRTIAAGLEPATVIDAATRVPAQALGRHDVGLLAAGAEADLVPWDAAGQPLRVWMHGREVEGA